ncbi:MAG: hypothetical protein ACE5DZ_07835 [Mariprofundus sp.]
MFSTVIEPIQHGLIMAVVALICGALWAVYMATYHEQLHSSFEIQAWWFHSPGFQLENAPEWGSKSPLTTFASDSIE